MAVLVNEVGNRLTESSRQPLGLALIALPVTAPVPAGWCGGAFL